MIAIQRSRQHAFSIAIARLIEQYEPLETRLFNDPLIRKISFSPVLSLLKFKRVRRWLSAKMNDHAKGFIVGMNCRTRYVDELTEVVLQDGFRQVLILNAGMDTRAHRIKGIDDANVFELDRKEILAYKRGKILDEYGTFPAHVAYVPFNFYTQTIEEALKGTRFDFSRPTFIIWENGTQYLPKQLVQQTIDFIGKAAPGSHFAVTYILRNAIDKPATIPGAEAIIRFYDKQETPWIFGLHQQEIPELLAQSQLSLIEDIGVDYYREYYLEPLNRQLETSPVERVIFGKVAPAK